jgi:hypothetical protein
MKSENSLVVIFSLSSVSSVSSVVQNPSLRFRPSLNSPAPDK